MNITLSADEKLIQKGREYAKAHDTSLNQLVRDYLLWVTGSHEAEKSADEFARLATSMPGRSDEKFKFSRNSIYDRQALK
ncbi:MAG TPA: hypothetical protein DD827_03775 [Gammaproteobacteria bacterium]|jgi:hypothetical protein|nr:hypothetical protein [Gammaproteobacteria bacterium]